MATKEIIHDLFIQGKTYKEIGLLINSNASAVALRIKRYRKQEPESWPRLKNYKEPLNIKVQVFQCLSCVSIFAVEEDVDLNDDATCPYCWEKEQMKAFGNSYLKVHADC